MVCTWTQTTVVTFLLQIDMVQMKERFAEKYKGTLEEWIEDDCSGIYKDMLIAIITPK